MHSHPRVAFALSVSALLALVSVLRAQETEAFVVLDKTPAGEKLVRPTPAHPTYYMPVMMGGFKVEEGSYTFGNETPPSINAIAHQVAETLAQQGYLVAHPSLKFNARHEVIYADDTVLTVTQNPNPSLKSYSVHFDLPRDFPLTADMLQEPNGVYSFSRPSMPGGGQLPLLQVLHHVDPRHGPVLQGLPSIVLSIHVGNKLAASPGELPISATGVSMMDLLAGDMFDELAQGDKEEIVRRVHIDRYFVVVNAYDLPSLLQKRTVLLWSEKMSAPSNGSATFAKMLPLLLKVGGPSLGGKAGAQIFPIKMSKGEVIIGQPKVIQDDIHTTGAQF